MKITRKNFFIGFLVSCVVLLVGIFSAISIVGQLDFSVNSLISRFMPSTSTQALAEEKSFGNIPKPTFLTCSAVRDRTRDFLKLHYSFRSFSEELSSRTFQRFFQMLDPGKNFFLASDIEKFKPYEKTLPLVLARLDCKFIGEIYSLFKDRVKESLQYVEEESVKAFDYSTDESIETDRKKIPWAASVAELHDRWRRQLKFLALNTKDPDLTHDDIVKKLKKRQALMQKSIDERNMDEVNGIFLDAFASSLDPHSQFQMPADQDEFRVQFALQLVGIGAQLVSTDGYTVVEGVIPGGPAAKDGRLRKGDKIVAVDSGDGNNFVNVVDMDLNKVVQMIRGKKDTLVKLNILRKAESGEVAKLTLDLMRDIVNLPDGAAKSDIMNIDGKKIGVILLRGFYFDYEGSRQSGDYRSSANDVAKEIQKLKQQKVDGILVDLRQNGGGDLSECIRMSGFFIDKGSVVQVQDRQGDIESADDTQAGVYYSGPLGILVSKQSASASEIMAGALKDYGRAIILGNSRTYGKATVQHVVSLPGSKGRESDGALKVTVSKFFQPSGGSNQSVGVRSDVIIPDLFDSLPVAEETNEYALPHTEVSSSRTFHKIQSLDGIIPELKKRSAGRIAKSKPFQDLLESIKKSEKERDNTVYPLKPDAKDKDDAKKQAAGKATATPIAKATPTPAPKDVDTSVKVIDKDDIQILEAGRILLDSVELLHNKTDWTK